MSSRVWRESCLEGSGVGARSADPLPVFASTPALIQVICQVLSPVYSFSHVWILEVEWPGNDFSPLRTNLRASGILPFL